MARDAGLPMPAPFVVSISPAADGSGWELIQAARLRPDH
jgi:hypothetical protein